MRFVDTNVVLYAVSTAQEELEKRRIATQILAEGDLALSVQVLQEFYVQATRRRPSGRGSLTHQQACRLVESFLRFPVQEMTVGLLRAALESKDRYGISFWDASILEAARLLGCETVLSEDLSDGQSYGAVRVVNPFTRGRT